MAYGGSNDDVIDDVKWPWKVKIVMPISFRPIISKMARLSYNGAPIGNGMHGIQWSRDVIDNVTW